jgi:hypothetical protein
LCTSGNEVKEVEMGGHVAGMMKGGDAYNILFVRPERKKPFVKPTGRWGDNIKIDHKKVGYVWARLMWLKIRSGGGLL